MLVCLGTKTSRPHPCPFVINLDERLVNHEARFLIDKSAKLHRNSSATAVLINVNFHQLETFTFCHNTISRIVIGDIQMFIVKILFFCITEMNKNLPQNSTINEQCFTHMKLSNIHMQYKEKSAEKFNT